MTGPIAQHPLRIAMANELHARPFQPATAPGRILHLAFMPERDASKRDPAIDRAHLLALLDRFGCGHPAPDSRHHSADLGRVRLKWESHTEFVSYTLYESGAADQLFAGKLAELLDRDWIDAAPGPAIAAVQCELIPATDKDAALVQLSGPLARHFVGESLAASCVMDKKALIAGDFRVHEGGFTRFAVIVADEIGPRRIGRVAQRLLEIEVYRTLAMLALPDAREISARLNRIEGDLSRLIGRIGQAEGDVSDEDLLFEMGEISTGIEALSAGSAFRFDAASAYESIVKERIEVLNETQLEGRQMFGEFMVRRFDPALRTVHAAKGRLGSVSLRAARIADLLRTRVNVKLASQNQDVLESMNRRGRLQLRLQETVEGLSVVAVSYYAVGLAAYLGAPVAGLLGLSKTVLTALITVPVIFAVWLFVRSVKRRISKDEPAARRSG